MTETRTFAIMFTTDDDTRFPGRQILTGTYLGRRFVASFVGRREKAEQAIRDAFVKTERCA